MKAKMSSLIVLMLVILVSLPACGNSANSSDEEKPALPAVIDSAGIITGGNIEPVRFAEIASHASGVVSEVFVKEGQAVKKGDVLVRLGNSESAHAELARAEAALILAQRAFEASQPTALKDLGDAYETVRQALIQFDNFDIPSELAQGTPAEGVEKMYAKVEEARAEFEPYKHLGDDNEAKRIRKDQLNKAWADLNQAIRWAKFEADLNTAKSRLADAQNEFNALVEDTRESSLAKAQYESAQANLSAAEAALANVELVAPFDGTIADLNVRVGGSINAGQVAVIIADFSDWVVKTTDLTELDVVTIKPGQNVVVTLDAIPNITFNGKIQSVGQTYIERQGDIVYEVAITLSNSHPDMRWGMTAVVKFDR